MSGAVIIAARPEERSKGAGVRETFGRRRCWHVAYQFCGVSAEIAVYAETETEARAQAVAQLRRRGLKVAGAHLLPVQ
jgi:hypothetical protein